jgi:DNA-directed RNA polymerase subunit E'/Rpb7
MEKKDNIYLQTLATYRIYINSSKITRNIDTYLENNIKNEMEGKCRPEGYVRPGSVHLLKRSIGSIIGSHFTGKVSYDIVYSTDICNPAVGNIITARITNINKLGFLAENGPLMIIVPKMYYENKETEFRELAVDQEVKIEVVAKRFQLNDNKIEIFGKIYNPNTSSSIVPPITKAPRKGRQSTTQTLAININGTTTKNNSIIETIAAPEGEIDPEAEEKELIDPEIEENIADDEYPDDEEDNPDDEE